MAIHLHCRKNKNESPELAKIQSLPCKIYADEKAQVSKNFEPFVQINHDQSLEGTFRGHQLKGQQIKVPDDYVGLILQENVKPLTDKEERNFYVTKKFRSFISWNWDKNPSKNDKIIQALDWIQIAEALHSPISEE